MRHVAKVGIYPNSHQQVSFAKALAVYVGYGTIRLLRTTVSTKKVVKVFLELLSMPDYLDSKKSILG